VHVIATAGHVDHGKSTLVRALTQMEPDRWAEERRRGMTIDLGYAWTTLPNGTIVAFVDVPGHQRFVANMLAGVGPVPAVLFIVAADEGWSAQSTEHLAALDALQVRHGILVITKCDLGDAELAEEEARDYLTGTSLADMPAVAVSATTGAGLGRLRAALEGLTSALPGRVDGPARLWVDRVFTIRGAGTVVTGTLSSGAISVGDQLQAHPSGEIMRVRGIESLKQKVGQASGVARVALNLRGVKTSQLSRGDALTAPGQCLDVAVMDVRLRPAGRLPPQLILHVGSAAVPVRVRPLGDDTARLTLARSLPVRIGERGVLRDPGARRVAAAALVLDPLPPPLTRRGAVRRRALELAGMTGQPTLAEEIRRRAAVRRSDLILAGVPMPTQEPSDQSVCVADWLIDADCWTAWRQQLRTAVADWAVAHPMLPGLPRQAAVARLELPDADVLDALVRAEPDLVLDAEGVHGRAHHKTLPPEIQQQLDRMLQRLSADPLDAPEAPELAAAGLGDKVLAVATRDGRLIRLTPGVYLGANAVEEAVRRLRGLEQPFTMARAREALGTTRRVAVPLLELLDRNRRTVRIDSQLRRMRD
jgi:selenocysteine-specific elongation factor